jgi:hypothetical protein
MKIQLCIDRIEGKGIAVLLTDDGEQIDFPRKLLPKGARPGDVLSLTLERDPEATERLRKDTMDLQERLKKTDPGGDIEL